jgi:hypothetical protein
MKWLVGVLLLSSGVASARSFEYTPEPSNMRVVRQQRVLYNAVRLDRDLPRELCGGSPPLAVQTYRTAADTGWSVLSLGMWTPAHLRVSCPTTQL